MMSFADGFARLDSPCMSFVAGSTVVVWYLRSEMMMVAIYGKIYRKALCLMIKTMVSCRFSLKPIQ